MGIRTAKIYSAFLISIMIIGGYLTSYAISAIVNDVIIRCTGTIRQGLWWHEYVTMRDGIKLSTKVRLPDPDVWGSGPYPAIVIRTPYGIGDPSSPPSSDMSAYSDIPSHGYVWVHQDTRGRFLSEGVDRLFYDGAEDGYDTIEWVAEQPWCDGRVGQAGHSAMAITTYLTASQNPPHLVAGYAMVGSANLYNDFIYEGGAFRMADSMLWTLYQIPDLSQDHLSTVVPAPQQGNIPQYISDCEALENDLHAHKSLTYPNRPVDSVWWTHLPLKGYHSSLNTLQPWIDETLSHPSADSFRSHMDVIDDIDVPLVHIGGWYDMFARDTVAAFSRLQHKGNQKLIMGGGWHGQIGWPNSYQFFYDWFGYWLKGENTGIMDTPDVMYFTLGTDQWRYADEWNTPAYTNFYFHDGGVLSTQPCLSGEGVDTYVYDPNNPVLTYGGRNLNLPAGALDQGQVEFGRSDIMIYTSDVLSSSLEIKGNVQVVLCASSNCTDTDFTAKLIDVGPSGGKTLILDSIIRGRYRDSMQTPSLMTPGTIYEFVIDLGDISHVFGSGHRIQLSISSSNFPKYDRNLNTGNALYTDTTFNIAENTVFHDNVFQSYLILPS